MISRSETDILQTVLETMTCTAPLSDVSLPAPLYVLLYKQKDSDQQ